MNDKKKTKAQLIKEVRSLRRELNRFKKVRSPHESKEGRNATLNLLEDLTLEVEERKAVVKQLRASEMRNRLLLEHAGVGIGYWDLQGNLLMFNLQAARNINGNPEDFSGMNMRQLFGEKQARIYMSRIKKASKTTKPVIFEDCIAAGSEEKWYASHYSRILDDEGRISGVMIISEDITERKVTEIALQESEDKYRQLFNHANDIVFLHPYEDEKQPGHFIEVNDTAVNVLGYKREDLLKCTPMDIVAPDDLNNVVTELKKIKKKKVSLFECTLMTRKGEAFPVEIHTTLFRYQGKATALSVCRDISERKKENALLVESERRYRDLAELLPHTIFEMDKNGWFLFVNETGLSVFGFSQKDITEGLNLKQLMTEESLKKARDNMRDILRGKRNTGNEYTAVTKEGKLFEVLIYSSPIYINGKHTGWRGTVIDMTERLTAEAALRQSTGNLQKAFEIAAIGQWKYYPLSRQFDWAESAIRVVGFSRKHLPVCWEDFQKYFYPDDKEMISAEMEKARNTGTCAMEHRIVINDQIKWVRIKSHTELDVMKGEPVVTGIIQDVTKQKHAEIALQESEELYRQLFESESDAIFLMDRSDGQILEVNEAASVMYGYSHDELLQMKNRDLLAKSEILKLTQKNTSEIHDNVIAIHVRNHRKKDGSEFTVEITGRYFDWQGRSVYIIAVRDITERIKSEEALHHEIEFNKQLAKFPSENPHPVLRIEADGTVVYANVAGMPVLKFWQCQLNERIPEAWTKLLKKILDSGRNQEVEISTGNHDYLLTFAPIFDSGYVNVYGLDVTSRNRAEQLIRRHREELQYLSGRLLQTQEEERKRLSRELHDEMGQALTAIKLNIASLEKNLKNPKSKVFQEILQETDTLLESLMEEMHHLALELRPSILDDLGLVPAIRWYVKQYSKRCDIKVSFEVQEMGNRLPPQHETILYRIVQESLTNIAKYANANRVVIRLQSTDEAVYTNIRDNGQGFDMNEVEDRSPDHRGIGLVGIHERVAAVDGIATIKSRSGKGTVLKIVLPLKKK